MKVLRVKNRILLAKTKETRDAINLGVVQLIKVLSVKFCAYHEALLPKEQPKRLLTTL